MGQVEDIVRRLRQTIDLEGMEPIDALTSYMIGDLPNLDSAIETVEITGSSLSVLKRIEDLASDIEDLRGTAGTRQVMWQEIKDLTKKLNAQINES